MWMKVNEDEDEFLMSTLNCKHQKKISEGKVNSKGRKRINQLKIKPMIFTFRSVFGRPFIICIANRSFGV